MGNSNSLNKVKAAAANAKKNNDSSTSFWAHDSELLGSIREELDNHNHHKSSSSPRPRNKSSSRRSKKTDPLSMDEIHQLSTLVKQLKNDKEGRDLLKQFVEKQADLCPFDDPDVPPVPSIYVHHQKK